MKRLLITVMALASAAYLILPMPGHSAKQRLPDKIERKRGEVERKRAREGVLTQTISGYSTRIRSLQGDIRTYAGRERRLQTALDARRAQVQRVEDRLEIAQDRLAKLRARLKVATEALSDMLVERYKTDEPDILTVILESDGFSDLLDRTAFLDRVAEQDRRIVAKVRDLKRDAAVLTDELAGLRNEKQAAADAVLAQRRQITEARITLVDRQSNLADARASRRTVLARVRSQRGELEGDLRSLEREQARVQARIRAAQAAAAKPSPRPARASGGGSAPSAPIRRGSGALIWPVNGSIVSPFGPRWGRLHAGIDIAVPIGTPVRAAQAGRVIISAPTGGYGNYICVAHSGSLSTCYAHNNSLSAGQGASVKQGQVIAISGNTGASQGPHVHFETRVNGSPVDPMGYL